MAQRDNNAIIVFLGVIIGICVPLIFYLMLRLMTVDAALVKNKREVDRTIILLREERERFKQERKDTLDGKKDADPE